MDLSFQMISLFLIEFSIPLNIVDSTGTKCSNRLKDLVRDLKADITCKLIQSQDVLTTKDYSIAGR